MYPDFLGIGAQKSGTTWLHRNMNTHPEIWMPARKELHYFDEKIKDASSSVLRTRLLGKRSSDYRWRKQFKNRIRIDIEQRSVSGLRQDLHYFLRRPGDKWYAKLFDPGRGMIKGEITPAYSMLETDMIGHVHSLMPDTKLIFMMRNPVERVWSHNVMNLDSVQKGSASSASEDEVIKNIQRKDSRRLTNFPQILDNWTSFYPEDQIFVCFMEDVNFCPKNLMYRLYEFLGVDPGADHRVIQRKIHSRSTETMPTHIAARIAEMYEDTFQKLSDRFGGYASFWLYCAQRLAEDPPEDETIAYPLWESQLWQQWIAQNPDFPTDPKQPLSGVLSTLMSPSQPGS